MRNKEKKSKFAGVSYAMNCVISEGFQSGRRQMLIIGICLHMSTPEKEQQERRPSLSIDDHFRKIIIVGDDIHRKEDELEALTVGLLDFLTDKNLLEQG